MKSIARVWRKSRIAALILRRETTGRLTPRDIRIGRALGEDDSVTQRLIAQVMKGYELRDTRLGRTSRPPAQNTGSALPESKAREIVLGTYGIRDFV